MIQLGMILAVAVALSAIGSTAHSKMAMQTFPVLGGAGAHDVYPAPDGAVWFTAQSAGKLGRLDPRTGKSDLVALGPDAAPHGVIVGPDSAAWVTEGGQNAIARVDPTTRSVRLFPLPEERRNANLNTASFDLQGVLWFYRAERHLRSTRYQNRRDGGIRRTARPRSLRHRHNAGWPSVLRLARRQLSRPNRSQDWSCYGLGAACAPSRRTARLER